MIAAAPSRLLARRGERPEVRWRCRCSLLPLLLGEGEREGEREDDNEREGEDDNEREDGTRLSLSRSPAAGRPNIPS